MKETALLIIDVQLGMFESPLIPPVYSGERLLATIKRLIGKARASSTPIFFIQHNGEVGDPIEKGTPQWHIHPAIAPANGEMVIQKNTPDSFHETSLKNELSQRNINNLVLTGIQTDYCVDTTCRRAFSLGFNVTLVKDGHSTWDDRSLTAQQIIDHHNEVLGNSFSKLRSAEEIVF
ncbi:MAG TPA: cysteine hydrolase family protein [Blastocatellia bacterium]|nr:cysteine hydrolase family protein [Blastocatellia bacterium]